MNTRIMGIIPAAGRGRRMGTAEKPLLVVEGQPMLLGVAKALLGGGVDRLIIAVHPTLQTRLPAMPEHARLVINDDPNTGMIDSIRLAITAHEQWQQIGEHDGVLVCPCDAAGLQANDVQRCVSIFREDPTQIIIASHANKRGHPIIFPAAFVASVRSSLCDAGLNQLAKHHARRVRLVACASPGTIRNVNTPEDYGQFNKP